jgi:hypothetical protein
MEAGEGRAAEVLVVCFGVWRKGVVVLEKGARLPEGTRVRVEVPARPAAGKKAARRRVMRHAGAARGLPPDASRNLDHYLYGHPKR